jgi:bifunctional DNA-binding transcriptional regulator/antitoxin component of YhaV-PrlF toxin-antitoxin module
MNRFVLNLVSKNQLTLPKKLVELLQLETGDQVEIHLRGPGDIKLVPCTRVRKDILSPEIEGLLRARERAIDAGGDLVSLEDLDRIASARESRVRKLPAEARPFAKAKVQRKELSALK